MNLNNKVHDLIDKRWSPRAFDTKPVEPEKLANILEAIRRSPSCFNEQPWRYLIGTKGQGHAWDKIFSVLTESNQKWTKTAPVLALVVAKSDFTKTGKPNKHKFYDAGQSAAFLTIQATAEGLYVHQMAGFSPEKAIEVFGMPSGFEPITALALGYLGDPQTLPEDIRKNEEKKIIRKKLKEIIFEDWDQPPVL